MHSFDHDLELETLDNHLFKVNIADGWRVNVGPNGGYVAALLLRAAQEVLPTQNCVSFNCHYLSASVPGEAQIQVVLEKQGRSLSIARATLSQNDKTIAIAVVTVGQGRAEVLAFDEPMPEMTAPDEVLASSRMNPEIPVYSPFRGKYDQRIALGPVPPATHGVGVTGGWTRFAEPRRFDDLALVAISDSWFPSIFAREAQNVHTPTVDHTVHFLRPTETGSGGEFLALKFETQNAASGFLIEDGWIWDQAGNLIAKSRQLAIVLPGDKY